MIAGISALRARRYSRKEQSRKHLDALEAEYSGSGVPPVLRNAEQAYTLNGKEIAAFAQGRLYARECFKISDSQSKTV